MLYFIELTFQVRVLTAPHTCVCKFLEISIARCFPPPPLSNKKSSNYMSRAGTRTDASQCSGTAQGKTASTARGCVSKRRRSRQRRQRWRRLASSTGIRKTFSTVYAWVDISDTWEFFFAISVLEKSIATRKKKLMLSVYKGGGKINRKLGSSDMSTAGVCTEKLWEIVFRL